MEKDDHIIAMTEAFLFHIILRTGLKNPEESGGEGGGRGDRDGEYM